MLDVEPVKGEYVDIVCLKGRGAAPPENCGGPRGYRLMLTRQAAGPSVSNPVAIAASMKVLVEVSRDEPEIDWPLFEEAVISGWESIEARLERSGPLVPARFSLKETNDRLASWAQRRRGWR